MAQRIELLETADGLALASGDVVVRGDFSRMLARIRPHAVNRELLVRAAKVRGASRPCAIDATAGLGEDALLLAAAGFSVTMFERNPTIAALLRDALARAAASESSELRGTVSRMRLVEGDGVEALRSLPAPPDVVLLDPMFPARTKSADVKKKLRLLQQLEQPCDEDDEKALIEAALAAHPRKIVVKRPAKGPFLAERKPAYALSGKAVRFDVYLAR